VDEQPGARADVSAIQSANLALRFILELCARLLGLATGSGQAQRSGLAIGLPLALAVVWGVFVAPQAAVALPAAFTFVFGLVLLELTAAAVVLAGHAALGVTFGAVVIVNAVLMAIWRQ
jgi:tetrahydromethanopterin S-methyltransferase subunit F